MKHLLSAADLDKTAAVAILDTAAEMAQVNQREIKKLPTLRGKTVVNLFFEDSTRTRNSFEVAAKRLSADVINFSASGSSVSKGESLKDTAQTIEAMGVEVIVLRHGSSGAPHTLANSGWVESSVINAGDGTHEHPTQALLDAYTLRESLFADHIGKDLSGAQIGIVGDIAHSRVARSNLILLKTLGAKVSLVGPSTLIPHGLSKMADSTYFSLDDALSEVGFDAVMMLRLQRERMSSFYFPSEREYSNLWGLNDTRFRSLESKTRIMHPGPMNRGLEISSDVADSKESLILNQVANGVNVRMAVLAHLLSGGKTIE